MFYNGKAEISGNVVQIREYKKKQMVENGTSGVRAKSEKRKLTEEEKALNRKKAGQRARHNMMRIVNSNFGDENRGWIDNGKSVKFLTLTYARNMLNRDELSKDWEKFVKRLEYNLSEKIEYLAIPEQQKRGAWHLHVIMWCSYVPIETLKKIWNKQIGFGSFKIERINHIHDLGKYLGKYMAKEFGETQCREYVDTSSKKRFFTSRGLKDKTLTIKKCFEKIGMIEKFKEVLSCVTVYQREARYTGEYTGEVQFVEMCLNRYSSQVYLLLRELIFDLFPLIE